VPNGSGRPDLPVESLAGADAENRLRWQTSGTYVANENEELYGTWTNDQYSAWQEIVYSPGSSKCYQRIGNSAPTIDCKLEITNKWKDSEGNIWYKSVSTIVGGTWGSNGWEMVTLSKLSKSAMVLELVWTSPTNEQEMKTPVYPTTMDPKRYEDYGLYNRAGN
jgi:hypothetical protein